MRIDGWRWWLGLCVVGVVLCGCGKRGRPVRDIDSRWGVVTSVEPLPDDRYRYEAEMQDDGTVRTGVTGIEVRKGWVLVFEDGRLVKAQGFTGRRTSRSD